MGQVRVNSLIGLRVKAIRPMTEAEQCEQGWDGDEAATVLVFEDGTTVFASRDPEGNGPGCLYGRSPKGVDYYVE